MLYPNSSERVKKINEVAQLFESKGYPKTANGVLSFENLLQEPTFPADLAHRFNHLLDTFHNEFSGSIKEGQVYREQVFIEIREIITRSVNKLTYVNFSAKSSELMPIVVSIKNGRNVIGDIASELGTVRKSSKRAAFHLCCYAYLVMVEGVFDDIARAINFFSRINEDKVTNISRLMNKRVGDILNEFSTVPTFLKDWEEKKHRRNAIAYATAYYNSDKDEVQFVDMLSPKPYDKTISLNDFLLTELEFEDVVDSFSYIMVLLGLIELFVIKNLVF